jgi:hypothetical protein
MKTDQHFCAHIERNLLNIYQSENCLEAKLLIKIKLKFLLISIFLQALRFSRKLTLESPVVTKCTICFNILKFYILHTQCICVFRMVLTINSDCFHKQH